ncbi:MAG TPA: hypothetical protein VLR49_07460 [Ferruginibacter sp.]|nr:hypothetical protein [Ferruginibacter sp.]
MKCIYFANQMKWTAFIFLVIFTMVQTAPAVMSVCNDISVSVFNPDEEKGTEKVNGNNIEDIKENKIYNKSFIVIGGSIVRIIVGFQGNKDKLPLPILDMITPPPNYA